MKLRHPRHGAYAWWRARLCGGRPGAAAGAAADPVHRDPGECSGRVYARAVQRLPMTSPASWLLNHTLPSRRRATCWSSKRWLSSSGPATTISQSENWFLIRAQAVRRCLSPLIGWMRPIKRSFTDIWKSISPSVLLRIRVICSLYID